MREMLIGAVFVLAAGTASAGEASGWSFDGKYAVGHSEKVDGGVSTIVIGPGDNGKPAIWLDTTGRVPEAVHYERNGKPVYYMFLTFKGAGIDNPNALQGAARDYISVQMMKVSDTEFGNDIVGYPEAELAVRSLMCNDIVVLQFCVDCLHKEETVERPISRKGAKEAITRAMGKAAPECKK